MRVFLVIGALGLTLSSGVALAQSESTAAQGPVTFPAGAKLAYVNIQRIATESAAGKESTAKVTALNEQKVAELGQRNAELQAAQQKLQQGLTVLSDDARGQLQKSIERMQVDMERFTQDAQAEVQDLQQELQAEFQRQLVPVIETVAAEKNLDMVFSQLDSGLVWANVALDLTLDIIKRFDESSAATAAPAPPQP